MLWAHPQYAVGYAAALVPPPEQPECPYAEGTLEHDAWHEGYSDATEDYIRSQEYEE